MERLSSSERKIKGGSARKEEEKPWRAGRESQRRRHEKKKMESRREARYLLPCLSESKRCQKVENKGGWGTERDIEGK